jgi:hypothetical protein
VPTRQKVAATVSLFAGLFLAVQGGHAIVDAALGRNLGDTAPELGYLVGGAALFIAVLLLSYTVRLRLRGRHRP